MATTDMVSVGIGLFLGGLMTLPLYLPHCPQPGYPQVDLKQAALFPGGLAYGTLS